MIPSWSKDPARARPLINARSETAASKPSFRAAFRKRRCVVPVDGFYEWRKVAGGPKQPIQFRVGDGGVFGLAGLWEHWTSPAGDAVETFTILTTEANELVAPVHDRMPVILPREAHRAWLDPEAHDPAMIQPLLVPFPASRMELDMCLYLCERVRHLALASFTESSCEELARIARERLEGNPWRDLPEDPAFLEFCADETNRPHAQELFNRWLSVTVLALGRPDSRADERVVELGLRSRRMSEVARDFVEGLEGFLRASALIVPDEATLGITDYAQKELGDIVYLEFPEIGRELKAGDELGTVESVKAVSEIYAPVAGEVLQVNESLTADPDRSAMVNKDPYGEGWLVKVKLSSKDEVKSLLDAKSYESFLQEAAD